MNVKQLREYIIKPTLLTLSEYDARMNSQIAVDLLVGTCLQESNADYVHQLGGGPALGIYQMEPATHDDIWENYLKHRPNLATIIKSLAGERFSNGKVSSLELIGNINYATAMARVHYWRVPAKLPSPNDILGMGLYWKNYYNTSKGKGTAEEFYKKYVKSLA